MTLFPSLAIFLQHAHGEYQAALLASLPYAGRLSLYEVNECVIRHAGRDGITREPLTSIRQLDASLFLFVQQPLESLNHQFLEEIAQTALRRECGMAVGVTLASNKAKTNALPADSFFALKRDLLSAAGGLPMVSTRSIGRLVDAAVLELHARGLEIVTAEHAVATLSELATVE